ncbi:hypothetical protein BDV95DRAFT_627699 [Massariosphaeria phaeospora]|uniref:Uncharacterized protein n=1 Tax=Massariosphaeria phaeospora TaxID=100035 RepID=A0A7C8MGN4_9PLEO|nr:hypothetical protein BDV95DRAFT_627699 [Massariosphaeria phaeospora]
MTSIQAKIQEAASRNTTILASLHETESAPSQLAQQISYIEDLNQQLRTTEATVAKLKKDTESELKDHKKYSQSTLRRLAHKASGQTSRFAEKAAKEEREYFDAIQAQKSAEDQLAYMRHLKADAEVAKNQYQAQTFRHKALQRELDGLYESIFTGPTPGFPDEDEKEAACTTASQHCDSLHQALQKERHTLFLLRKIRSKIADAQQALHKAHSSSVRDMCGGQHSSTMSKFGHLGDAESSIEDVRWLQSQILRDVAPEVDNYIGRMNIARGGLLKDLIYDNIFTDMEMHEKIKKSEAEIDSAALKCDGLVAGAEGREKMRLAEVEDGGKRLQEARRELQRAREQAFVRLGHEHHTGESVTGDVPPAYAPPPPPPPAYTG